MDPVTMKVASEDTELGYVIINASDFDPTTMTKYTEQEPEPKAKSKKSEPKA